MVWSFTLAAIRFSTVYTILGATVRDSLELVFLEVYVIGICLIKFMALQADSG
jgi:hypothetical protein